MDDDDDDGSTGARTGVASVDSVGRSVGRGTRRGETIDDGRWTTH